MASLPSYVAAAQPVPKEKRVPWFKTIAPTYAGIMLWFVFWHDVPVGANLSDGPLGKYSAFAGGVLSQGIGIAILGLVLAALICYFLFYLVPGLLGVETGLPLYIVGTSTYGVRGGFIMPGFLMGLLQFGWLSVNAFFAGILLCAPFNQGPGTVAHAVVATVWAASAAFLGLKGIKYVAKVATFLPVIPLLILVILFVATIGNVGKFDAKAASEAGASVQAKPEGATEMLKVHEALPAWKVIAVICAYVVGFFATAGAAGTDISMSNRDARDVRIGGFVGIALATIFAGVLSLLIVAGIHGKGGLADPGVLRTTNLMEAAVGGSTAAVFMYLLAIAAFPAACFSSLIAANSFKTTLPKVNPFITVGLGTVAAIILAVTGVAGNATDVFNVIGASFGPVCGAMAADYLLAGGKWAGPRAGFNPAGWISWVVGFAIGAFGLVAKHIASIAQYEDIIPAPPVAAFIVGFVLYFILAKAGLESQRLEYPAVKK
jgi:cytosine permease